MSYYLLPKKNTFIEIMPSFSENADILPHISLSLQAYLLLMKNQLKTITDGNEKKTHEYTIDFLQKIVNPYEYISTKVPGTKFAVSKAKPYSHSFYIFLEVIHILNLFETFTHKKINMMLIGPNSKSMNECIDIVRENYDDVHKEIYIDNIEQYKQEDMHSIDFMHFELEDFQYTNLPLYTISLINLLYYIIHYQNTNGVSIIKVQSIIHKPVLDFIFILTSLYEKVYIIKPNASSLCKDERFIVCKNFGFNINCICYYSQQIKMLIELYITPSDIAYGVQSLNSGFVSPQNKNKGCFISSILKNELPSFFLNKIEEANIIVGHQQLEAMEQIINLIKNKNREDKIETLKKNNIQKCIQWCEKYKIPYNKFVEKVNIFLNSIIEDSVPNSGFGSPQKMVLKQDLEQDLEQELYIDSNTKEHIYDNLFY